MDDYREQQLQRILDSRRKRGAFVASSQPTQPSASAVPPPLSTSSVPPPQYSQPAISARSPLRESSPAVVRSPANGYSSSSQAAGRSASIRPIVLPFASKASSEAPQYPTNAAYDNKLFRAYDPQPQSQPALPAAAAAVAYPTAAPMHLHHTTATPAAANRAESPPLELNNQFHDDPTKQLMMGGSSGRPGKGAFDNFRTHPIVTNPDAIRPYRKNGATNAAVSASPSRNKAPFESSRSLPSGNPALLQQQASIGQQPTTSAGVGGLGRMNSDNMNSIAAASFSNRNPFRKQTFEDFCVAPEYEQPPQAGEAQRKAREPPPSGLVVPRGAPGTLVLPPSAPPLFDPEQSLKVLQKGDWFLKWTRIDSVHRRYVWVDLTRGVLSWAKSRDSSFFLQSSIKLEDIVDLQPQCVVDDTNGRTFYKLVVVSPDRVLKIGTELREKFDIWFDVIQRLWETQRSYNTTFIGRHASINKQGKIRPEPFARKQTTTSSTE